MPDILQTSLSGLIAFQRALATTSNNIANASTDGYSRQRVELVARQPELLGSGFIGRGVDLASVRRIVDLLAVSQLRGSNSDLGRLETYSALAGRVVNALGDSTSGLPAQLSAFFAAWQDVATNPTSTAARQQLLSQAQTLAGTFRTAAATLDGMVADTNAGIAARVEQINQLAGSIARINSDIEATAAAAGGQPPNDLLDQRDALLTQLSKLVNITTVADADGSVNVFMGNGQTLVLRGFTAELDAVPSALDASRLEISYRSDVGTQTITQFVTGGELGGLLQGRSELIDGVRCQLGLVAASLAAAVNDQQNAGMDLFGRLGADMFSVSGPQAIAATGNTGAATLAATIADLGALTGDDYVLRFDGVAWTAMRASNGQVVTLAGTGTVADPLRLDGLAVVVGGAASAGDRYTLRGTRDALGSMRALLVDPRSVAAAAPIRASALAANLGSASVTAGEVVDASDPNLMATVDIRFITPTTYSINGAGSYGYTSGADIVVNGWRVRVSGTPAAGDVFRIERNASGAGDNRNALLAAGLQLKGVLDGGTTSLGDGLIRLVGRAGTLAGQADAGLRAQQVIQSNSMAAVQTASGVNLDEEAADMLRWQQAYQASAQMIKAASTLFDTLLSAVRG